MDRGVGVGVGVGVDVDVDVDVDIGSTVLRRSEICCLVFVSFRFNRGLRTAQAGLPARATDLLIYISWRAGFDRRSGVRAG